MKNQWLSLVGIAFLVVTSIVLWGPLSLKQAQGQTVSANNFEYKFYRIDFNQVVHLKDYQQIAKKHPKESRIKFLEHLANHLGKQGWEMVTINYPMRGSVAKLYFRRAKP